jgi:hypothetical protein
MLVRCFSIFRIRMWTWFFGMFLEEPEFVISGVFGRRLKGEAYILDRGV